MSIVHKIQNGVVEAVKELFGENIDPESVTLTPTRKEFEGDYTVVVFPYTKIAKKGPAVIAQEMGAFIENHIPEITSFNVIQGFLNLTLSADYWTAFLQENMGNAYYGMAPKNGKKVMVEFSSPNTNKPLHLGHIRNILLGWSCSQILEAAGNEVFKVQVINDRGIAICKSMLAWQKFGEGKTPENSGIKGDHLVGDFYVSFEKHFQEEYKAWQETDEAKAVLKQEKKEDQDEASFFKKYKEKYFNQQSKLGAEARAMLLDWEAGKPEVVALWKKMNGWVYEGFDKTYEKLGVSFDQLYYESETYLLGKEMVEKGLSKDVFYKKEDGSVWADLTDAKLDHKVVLRSDGTSVYITQDIGTAHKRYEEYGVESMVYVVADEQNYHFQVLFEILKRLEEPYANGLHHLSYGMVDLPTGKMKSREGTVVDADDLIAEVVEEAKKAAGERGEITEANAQEQEEIIFKIGMAALKFYIIKVSPKKRMTFNPAESVDLQGQTGPYVQNAYVRIKSVLRKALADQVEWKNQAGYDKLEPGEKELLSQLYQYPSIIQEAADNYDPSTIANYAYALAKEFHKFYHDHSILKAESAGSKIFRLQLSNMCANVLKSSMHLLGIDMPERM
ncbi:MAG: arginine--tRNA ligase [Saprospiraceae bacterium]